MMAAVAACIVIMVAEAAGGLVVVTFILAVFLGGVSRRRGRFGRRANHGSGGRAVTVSTVLFWLGKRSFVGAAAPLTDAEFKVASWGK